jgi:DNA-binding LytR/AlgR family response regulator
MLAGVTARPYVIYVTAHAQHALDAFALHADDYLLKPYKDERLLEAVAYAKGQIQFMGSRTEKGAAPPEPQASSGLTKGATANPRRWPVGPVAHA